MKNKIMKTKYSHKIIITGGSGFIGTNLIEYLIQNNFNFINIDVNPQKIAVITSIGLKVILENMIKLMI